MTAVESREGLEPSLEDEFSDLMRRASGAEDFLVARVLGIDTVVTAQAFHDRLMTLHQSDSEREDKPGHNPFMDIEPDWDAIESGEDALHMDIDEVAHDLWVQVHGQVGDCALAGLPSTEGGLKLT